MGRERRRGGWSGEREEGGSRQGGLCRGEAAATALAR